MQVRATCGGASHSLQEQCPSDIRMVIQLECQCWHHRLPPPDWLETCPRVQIFMVSTLMSVFRVVEVAKVTALSTRRWFSRILRKEKQRPEALAAADSCGEVPLRFEGDSVGGLW